MTSRNERLARVGRIEEIAYNIGFTEGELEDIIMLIDETDNLLTDEEYDQWIDNLVGIRRKLVKKAKNLRKRKRVLNHTSDQQVSSGTI